MVLTSMDVLFELMLLKNELILVHEIDLNAMLLLLELIKLINGNEERLFLEKKERNVNHTPTVVVNDEKVESEEKAEVIEMLQESESL